MEKMPIERLNFSTRSHNCLKRNKINTVAELLTLTREKILSFKNMGSKSVDEVIEMINLIKKDNTYFEDEENNNENNSFEQETSALILDAPIEMLELSSRLFNCLKNNGVNYVKEFVFVDENQIGSFGNVGVKCTNEFLNILQKIDCEIKEENQQEKLKMLFPEWILKAIKETVDFYSISISKSTVLWKKAYDDSEIKNVESVVRNVYKNEIVNVLLERKILETSTDWNYVFYVKNLKQQIPNTLITSEVLFSKLQELEQQGKIECIDNDSYMIKYPSILDFIETIDNEREKKLFVLKLEGKTLKEIGDCLDITRERTRQICSQKLQKRPRLREDKYIELFETYDIDEEDFIFIFEETEQTFNYLEMVCQVSKEKKIPVERMLTECSFSPQVKERIDAAIHKNSVWDNGTYVLKTRQELFKHYFKSACLEKTSLDQVFTGYEQFLRKHHLEEDKKLAIESRAYENLISGCNFALSTMGKACRYYDVENENNNYYVFVQTLGIDSFMDKEISTLKLFKDNREMMEDFDIHDEYELHNLLKKIWRKYGNCEVEFAKMPTLRIGKSNEKQQMLEFLMQNAPILGEELAKAYEQTYGVKSALVLVNYLKYFSIYYHQGVFKVDFEMFSDEQYKFMKDYLVEKFYTIADVKRIFLDKFPNSSVTLINSYNIKQLGYQVYVDYILKKEMTMTEYSEWILSQYNEFCLDDFNKALRSIVMFTTILYEKRAAREIVEKSPCKYVSIDFLKEHNITKQDLENYCLSVSNFVNEGEYFTIKSIRENGFNHRLHDLDYENWFYSSILIEDKNKFKYTRLGNKARLLCYRCEDATLPSFLEWFVKNKQITNVNEIMNALTQNYGIDLKSWEIIEAIRKTSLSFDAVTKKISI